jgi:hypothetical protein
MAEITDFKAVPLIDLMKNIERVKYDPSGMITTILNHLEDVTEGRIDIVDPTNPFVFLLESSCVNTSAAIVENEIQTRNQYPSLAQNEEQVYRHMSDKDFINRFATPAKTQFSFLIQFNDLVQKMADSPSEQCKKVTILRDTEFYVDNIAFCAQYPVHIKQFYNNIVQVAYDNSIPSPIMSLSTNIVEYQIKTDASGIQWLFFNLDVIQVQETTTYFPIQASTYFSEEIDFPDQYFFTRVWYMNNNTNEKWVEMLTTHTDQVFDIYKPTAILKVIGNAVTVFIPAIYVNNGTVDGNLRIDIYTTKGAINLNLSNYTPYAFSSVLKAIDEARDVTDYSHAMNDVSFLAYSDKLVAGGTNGLTFTQLREQVIYNAIGNHNLPVTNIQLKAFVENLGFTIIRNVDNVTNRIYMAAKDLPKPLPSKLLTPANLTISTLITSIEELATMPEVWTNAGRTTLTSKTVYQNENGVLSIYPASKVQNLKTLLPASIADVITSGSFMYSPFYYVLDTTLNEFEIRPYHLDSPKAGTLNFVAQNPTALLQVNTDGFTLEKTDSGYLFTVVVRSDTFYKKLDNRYLQAQLAFIPPGENHFAYVNGRISGLTTAGERIFVFDIKTNHDINNMHQMVLKNFKMFSNENMSTKTTLLNTFNIFYTTTSVPVGFNVSNIDASIGKFMLPADVIGITHETIDLTLGFSLKNLWSRSRSVMTGLDYITQTHDRPAVYENDVYDLDPVTQSFLSVGADGELVYKILHSKGDIVLDEAGNTVYEHKKGDLIYINGEPLIDVQKKTLRYVDMLFVDGNYFFADDPLYVTYRKDVATTIATWVNYDLGAITDILLEQTKIFYYPKRSIGSVAVMIQNDITTTIEAMQSFTVDIFVNSSVYLDARIRAELERTTIEVLDNAIKETKVSISDIIIALRSAYGASAITVRVSGLGGDKKYETVTLMRASDRLSLKKRLVSQDDGSLIVKENVIINFIEYFV